jgi:Purple acid Phosphatase, N-terminal domain
MNKMILEVVILATAGGVLSPYPLPAQVSPTTPKAARIRITHGPELESSNDYLTIIRWTTNNPGGSPVHYGVVHYGTDPKHLDQTAKNPIRLNPSHPSSVFRVRVEGLKLGTTYYYTVESEEANGTNDGVKSTVKQFKVGPQ